VAFKDHFKPSVASNTLDLTFKVTKPVITASATSDGTYQTCPYYLVDSLGINMDVSNVAEECITYNIADFGAS